MPTRLKHIKRTLKKDLKDSRFEEMALVLNPLFHILRVRLNGNVANPRLLGQRIPESRV